MGNSTSQSRLAYITEAAWGTTPATPGMTAVRMTGESLNANIDNVVSDEIRADRNVSDLIQVGQSSGGAVDFELTYGGFTDDFLESLMFSAWSTNVLKNGIVQKQFTLEKTFETGATDQYHRLTGAVVNSMSLSMAAGSIVTGSFDFVAKGLAVTQAIITGATYTAGNTNTPINAATNFASLAMTGVTAPALTALDLNITNNVDLQRVLGSLDGRDVTPGRFEVSGSLTAYFENATMYALFLAGTAADLTFKLGGASSKNYLFNIPSLKFENAQVVAGGNDQPLLITTDFRGLFNAGEAASLKITRTP